MNDIATGSGLSEEDLFKLWMKVREAYPRVFELHIIPSLQDGLSEDDLMGRDGGIHVLLACEFPDLATYPDRHLIYTDMLSFLEHEEMMALKRAR